jgi:hypothetical protein
VVWYLDTSAFLKLIVTEPETSAMRAWIAGAGPCWSSQLLRTEAMRAAERLGINEQAVTEALDTVSLVVPGTSTFLTAGRLRPPALRSLDALHLATALEIGHDIEGLVTYNTRMVEGARTASIAVLSPR